MKNYFFFLFLLLFNAYFVLAQEVEIPPKIENEIFVKLKRFEGEIDNLQNIEDILKYDHHFVEEIIFKHINATETNTLNYLLQNLKLLGNFDSHRAILTLAKHCEPFISSEPKEKVIPRPRYIRDAAINALLQKPNPERNQYVIKYIADSDPNFQCLVLKLLKEKKIKEAIEPTYEMFKKSNTNDLFKVKVDAATLIMALSTDPQLKNSVLLNMLIDPNIHIRKAGLNLFTEGGEAGDSEIRKKLLEVLKNSKDNELELACKGAGILKAKETQNELLTILNRESNPLIKWECLNSLHKINYDINELNIKIKELLEKYSGKEKIKNAEFERFQRLLDYINKPKETK